MRIEEGKIISNLGTIAVHCSVFPCFAKLRYLAVCKLLCVSLPFAVIRLINNNLLI